MSSDDGRGRRPEAGVLDPNMEYYAGGGEGGRGDREGARGRNRLAVERLKGLLLASETLDAEIRGAIACCLKLGVGATLLARVLGVHRATIYRRYAGGRVGYQLPDRLQSGQVPWLRSSRSQE
jgi:hypothetical protein